MAAHSLAEDEAFARMLQQEEDDRNAGRYSRNRPGADAADHQLTQSFVGLDVEDYSRPHGARKPPPTPAAAIDYRRSQSLTDEAQALENSVNSLGVHSLHAGDQVPSSQIASGSFSNEGSRDYVRISAGPQATAHLHGATMVEHMKFARQLQEKALAEITVDTSDAELARKMQDLETQGLGRMNSHRRVLDTGGTPASANRPHGAEAVNAVVLTPDEKIARYLQSTGKSFSALTEDVINTITEDEHKKKAKSPPRNSKSPPRNSKSPPPPSASDRIPEIVVTEPALRSSNTVSTISSCSTSPLTVSPVGPTLRQSVSGAFEAPSQVVIARSPSLSVDVPRGVSPEPPKIRAYKESPANKARSAPTTPTRARKMLTTEDTAMSSFDDLLGAIDANEPLPKEKEKKKKKKRLFLGFVGKNSPAAVSLAEAEAEVALVARAKAPEPAEPRPPPRTKSPVPGGLRRHSSPKPTPGAPSEPEAPPAARRWFKRPKSPAHGRSPRSSLGNRNTQVCAGCGKTNGSFLAAMDKKFHPECFRCKSCNKKIDPTGEFKISEEEDGSKHPHHVECYSEMFGIRCAVCRNPIAASHDGSVTFVKHPFFDTEHMCLSHAENPGRRCSGCQRFEPEDEPFVDLHDAGRCVCYACCRSVIVDKDDVQPLWEKVLQFFEEGLKVPVWSDMKQIPILVVGTDSLKEQMKRKGIVHGGAPQHLTAGLCLTDTEQGRRFKLPSMKFDKMTSSFRSIAKDDIGYTYYELPRRRDNQFSTRATVTAILCLTGLPRDLTASILAQEATHAWIKLHPDYSEEMPLPPQVEEGCAQLIAMLLLSEGLAPADTTNTFKGPSDEKLRQYFKFNIEHDDNEISGMGYRRASRAYRAIGIEALLAHAVRYREFPQT